MGVSHYMSTHTFTIEDLQKLWVPIETNILQYTWLYMKIMFSPFNMTCLVVQESVVIVLMCYSTQYNILVLDVVLSRFFKEMAYFNVKCHFVYTMKIHKYKRIFLLKKYAHSAIQYGV